MTGTVWALEELASVAREEHDERLAVGLQRESLRLSWRAGNLRGVAISLNGLAGLALDLGRPDLSARLLGAATSLVEARGLMPPDVATQRAHTLAEAQSRLGEKAFERQFSAGRMSSVDQAIDEAMAVDPANVLSQDRTTGLTARELEVLRLVAGGRSNKEIADVLVLSIRTVERHITNLYAKIGARGKADATAYAFQHGLM